MIITSNAYNQFVSSSQLEVFLFTVTGITEETQNTLHFPKNDLFCQLVHVMILMLFVSWCRLQGAGNLIFTGNILIVLAETSFSGNLKKRKESKAKAKQKCDKFLYKEPCTFTCFSQIIRKKCLMSLKFYR